MNSSTKQDNLSDVKIVKLDIAQNPLEKMDPVSSQNHLDMIYQQARLIVRLIEEAKFEGKTQCRINTHTKGIYPENRRLLHEKKYDILENHSINGTNCESVIKWHNHSNMRLSPLEKLESCTDNNKTFTEIEREAQNIVDAIKKAQAQGKNMCEVKIQSGMDRQNLDALLAKNYQVNLVSCCVLYPQIISYTITWKTVSKRSSVENNIIKNGISKSPIEVDTLEIKEVDKFKHLIPRATRLPLPSPIKFPDPMTLPFYNHSSDYARQMKVSDNFSRSHNPRILKFPEANLFSNSRQEYSPFQWPTQKNKSYWRNFPDLL